MEKFCLPNLPSGRVRRAFISGILPDAIVSELNDLGVRTYKLGKSSNIRNELAYHPDILINNYAVGIWVCEKDAAYLPDELPATEMFEESEETLGELYPYDCLFNTFRIGNRVFCGKHASHTIKFRCEYEQLEACFVPQGYAKCAVVIVSEKACITCDMSLFNMLRKKGIEVLLLPDCEGIGLNGFGNGLIGGCATLLGKDILAFTGNLNTYKFGGNIVDFCKDFGVDAMSLTNDDMYDYGGILPVSEIEQEVIETIEEHTSYDISI